MKFNSTLRATGLVLAGAVSAFALMQAFNGASAATSKADTYKLLGLFGDVFDRVAR